MTVKQLTQIERYVGPSTATKPLDCSVGSTFLEEDTSRLFVFDGTGWFPKTQDIVIYDAEGNPLEIEGGRMKVSVDASVVAPEEVVWSNITLRDGQNPSNKLAVLPDGSLKVQQSGSEEFAQDVTVQGVKSELEAVKSELVLVKSGIEDLKENQTSGDQKVTLSGTIQPQWQERILVFSAGKYTQNQSIVVERPAYAKGVILVVKVSKVSGTFGPEEGWATRVRGYWGTNIAAVRDLIHTVDDYTSEYLSSSSGWSATMIYPQALGDVELYSTTQQALLHREEMLLGSHVRFELDIKGTFEAFEADEGITIFDSVAYWLS